jgi:hypothetical protein
MKSVSENTERNEHWRIRWIDWLIGIWGYSNLQTVSPKVKRKNKSVLFSKWLVSRFQQTSSGDWVCIFRLSAVLPSAVKYMFGTRPLSRGVVWWWGDRPIQQCICDWRWTTSDRIRQAQRTAHVQWLQTNLQFGGLLFCCSDSVQKITSTTRSLTIFQCHLLIAWRSLFSRQLAQ